MLLEGSEIMIVSLYHGLQISSLYLVPLITLLTSASTLPWTNTLHKVIEKKISEASDDKIKNLVRYKMF